MSVCVCVSRCMGTQGEGRLEHRLEHVEGKTGQRNDCCCFADQSYPIGPCIHKKKKRIVRSKNSTRFNTAVRRIPFPIGRLIYGTCGCVSNLWNSLANMRSQSCIYVRYSTAGLVSGDKRWVCVCVEGFFPGESEERWANGGEEGCILFCVFV